LPGGDGGGNLSVLMEGQKVIVPFPRGRGVIATHVRSTLVLSSLQSLRSHDLFDRYSARVDPATRESLVTGVAGVWLPMSLGLRHYRACEEIGLSPRDQVAIGYEVGERIQGSLFGLFVRTAKNMGATPWLGLEPVARLWDRVFEGGTGPSVIQLGPKEARVELVGLPLLDVPYFRQAFRGTFMAALELFCVKVYVNEIRGTAKANAVSFRVSWV
jgi:hypothetical protein